MFPNAPALVYVKGARSGRASAVSLATSRPPYLAEFGARRVTRQDEGRIDRQTWSVQDHDNHLGTHDGGKYRHPAAPPVPPSDCGAATPWLRPGLGWDCGANNRYHFVGADASVGFGADRDYVLVDNGYLGLDDDYVLLGADSDGKAAYPSTCPSPVCRLGSATITGRTRGTPPVQAGPMVDHGVKVTPWSTNDNPSSRSRSPKRSRRSQTRVALGFTPGRYAVRCSSAAPRPTRAPLRRSSQSSSEGSCGCPVKASKNTPRRTAQRSTSFA